MGSSHESRPSGARPNQDPLGCVFTLFLYGAIVTFTVLVQLAGWVMGPMGLGLFISVSDGGLMAWASIVQGAVLGVPLLILGLLWRGPRYRAVFRIWLLAMGLVLIMAPARWIVPTASQAAMCWQIAVIAAYTVFAWLVTGPRPAVGATSASVWMALACGVLFSYPWLAWGALGSPLDIVLGLILSAEFALLAALLVGHLWLTVLDVDSRGLGWDLLTGGLVIGTTFFIMGSGFGFNGSHVLLMLYLPALAWVVTGLAVIGRTGNFDGNWLALALFVGLAVAGPLLFVDTDPMYFAFVVSAGEAGVWALKGLAVSLPLAWLIGLVLLLYRRRLCGWRSTRFVSIAAVAVLLLGGLLYLTAGRPGFYGDRLFVVLKDQADVSSAAAIEDYDERRQFVYETLVWHANATQADLRSRLEAMHVRYTPYYLVNALEVEGGPLHRLWLEHRPEVDRVMASPILRPLPEPVLPGGGDDPAPKEPQWNLLSIGADRVWTELGVRGRGVVIGHSDSGVQGNHPELADTYRGKEEGDDYNWLDPWYDTPHPVDFGGHGTHTLGSIVGKTVGVAPEAEWYACANLARNLGNPAIYLSCMQFMLAPYPAHGDPFADGDATRSANVLNNSWGCPEDREGCDAASLLPAVKALRAAGIFVVAAAGNEGPKCGTVKDPIALYEESFSVGAVDRLGNIADFSSMGPVNADGSGRVKPDIVAPGEDVLSSTPGSTYGTASGTSMAGPHVVGVVALMWSANPSLIGNIERTEQILIETAQPYAGARSLGEMLGTVSEIKTMPELPQGQARQLPFWLDNCLDETDFSVVPNNVVGYGVVDAYAAVTKAMEASER